MIILDRSKFIMANLGCGSRYHPDWINIDISPAGPNVFAFDLSQSIPLADSSCDVIYNSAMLEHLRRPAASKFLSECFRVLKPKGLIRVVVPDLEKLCQVYLSKLNSAAAGGECAIDDYEWITIELLDQTVREKSGGEMLAYLSKNLIPNEAFVYERIGECGRLMVNELRERKKSLRGDKVKCKRGMCQFPVWEVIGNHLRHFTFAKMRRLTKLAKRWALLRLLSRDDLRALEIGRFRLAGEVHQWMYDRYSLGLLFQGAGFRDPTIVDAKTSQIPKWSEFSLDTLPDGTVIKPDSLFMEAVRPENFRAKKGRLERAPLFDEISAGYRK